MKALPLTLTALLLSASFAQAAVTIDSQEAAGLGHRAITSPLTWNFTNAAGTRLLVGCVASGGSTGAAITAITDNGVPLTKVGTGILSGNSSSLTQWFTLVNPATGSHPIVVTWSAGGSGIAALCGALSLTGVDPVTPFGPELKATGNGSGLVASSGPVTSTAGNLVISLVSAGTSIGLLPAPDIVNFKLAGSTGNSGDNVAASVWVSTGATRPIVWTVNGTTLDAWAVDALEVRGAAGPPPPTVTATASWNANPEADIAGYIVSYGTASGVYTTVTSVGLVTQAVLPGFTPGTTYFFAVQATNTSGMTSPASTEVAWTAPASTPPSVILSNVRIVAQR